MTNPLSTRELDWTPWSKDQQLIVYYLNMYGSLESKMSEVSLTNPRMGKTIKVALGEVELDLGQAGDIEFAQWYQKHQVLTKQMVLCGYYCVSRGVTAYYEQNFVTERDDTWRRRCNELERAVEDKVHELDEVRTEVARQIELAVALEGGRQKCAYDADMRRYQGVVTGLERELGALQTRQCDDTQALVSAKEMQIATLRDTLEGVREELEGARRTAQQQAELRAQRDVLEAERRCRDEAQVTLERMQRELMEAVAAREKYAQMYTSMSSELVETVKGAMLGQVDEMRRQIEVRDRELALLKKSNMGRGNYGEGFLMGLVNEVWPAWEVADMSKVAHKCDFHVRNEEGEYYAFESKYKDNITKGDLDKFMSDVQMMSHDRRFLGGVFVSVKTRAIPFKGDIHFEFVNKKPVVYMGFAGTDSFDNELFAKALSILAHVARYQTALGEQATDAMDVIKRVAPMLDGLKRLRSAIERLRTNHLTAAMSATHDMEKQVRDMLELVHTVVGDVLPPVPTNVSNGANVEHVVGFKRSLADPSVGLGYEAERAACCKCGKTYNKRGLASHQRACTGEQ